MYSLSNLVDVKATANKIIAFTFPAPNENNIKMFYLILSLVNSEIQEDEWNLKTGLNLLKPEFSDNFLSIISQSSDGIYTLYIFNYTINTTIQG